jgi:putative oxidoreductase
MSSPEIVLPYESMSLLLLLVRVVLAVAFLGSCYSKSKNIAEFAKQNGLTVPVAYGVAIYEGVMGAALLIGMLAQFAALGIMLLMLNTIALHTLRWKSAYWATSGGWEYDLILFTLAAVIFVFGAGNYALFK